ncbi:ATP-binding protein [bacterium]|nr:ATP-binding protein [bacterium]
MIKRTAVSRIEELSKHFPVIMVCGARQTGKTTLLKEFARKNGKINYVTLDYPVLKQLAKSDPELFLQQYETPLIIDEIQYAPELLPFIKINVDRKNTSGQYFLTGSQMFHAMKNVSESLAGRVAVISLYSLSYSEISGKDSKAFLPEEVPFSEQKRTISEVFGQIYRGGMPKLSADKEISSEDYFGSYMQTYLERDIRDLINIRDEERFLRFISCVAARTAQEVNLSDISKDIGIDSKTADSWLSVLVSSGIVFLLSPFSANTVKRIVKRPKLYFMDTGLACYLSLWNNPRALELSAMSGAMFETYVVSEIIKSYANAGVDVRSRLCYYRDNNSKEIDLLIVQNGKIFPIEIKKSANPGRESLKNFNVIHDLSNFEVGKGCILCMAASTLPLDSMNSLIPIDAI